jgi:hypothetical protein
MHYHELNEAHVRLPKPHRLVETAMAIARLTNYSTHPYSPSKDVKGTTPNNGGAVSREPLLRLGTHPNPVRFRSHGGSPEQGMLLYEANRPTSPMAKVQEAFMGFRMGDNEARVSLKTNGSISSANAPTSTPSLGWWLRVGHASSHQTPTQPKRL